MREALYASVTEFAELAGLERTCVSTYIMGGMPARVSEHKGSSKVIDVLQAYNWLNVHTSRMANEAALRLRTYMQERDPTDKAIVPAKPPEIRIARQQLTVDEIVRTVETFVIQPPANVLEAHRLLKVARDLIALKRDDLAWRTSSKQMIKGQDVQRLIMKLHELITSHLGQSFTAWATQRGVSTEDAEQFQLKTYHAFEEAIRAFSISVSAPGDAAAN